MYNQKVDEESPPYENARHVGRLAKPRADCQSARAAVGNRRAG